MSTKNSLHDEAKLTKILAPVGVVNSSLTGPPITIMLEFLKISVIAYAGFDVVPCEKDIVPPPIATCEHDISSSNRFRSSKAIATSNYINYSINT